MIIDIEVVVEVDVDGIGSDVEGNVEGNIEFVSVVRLERVVPDIVAVEKRL